MKRKIPISRFYQAGVSYHHLLPPTPPAPPPPKKVRSQGFDFLSRKNNIFKKIRQKSVTDKSTQYPVMPKKRVNRQTLITDFFKWDDDHCFNVMRRFYYSGRSGRNLLKDSDEDDETVMVNIDFKAISVDDLSDSELF